MPSTVIRSFAYDAEKQVLAVTFTSGRMYRYCDVPKQVAEGMKSAFAKGEYFNEFIRGRYRFEAAGVTSR